MKWLLSQPFIICFVNLSLNLFIFQLEKFWNSFSQIYIKWQQQKLFEWYRDKWCEEMENFMTSKHNEVIIFLECCRKLQNGIFLFSESFFYRKNAKKRKKIRHARSNTLRKYFSTNKNTKTKQELNERNNAFNASATVGTICRQWFYCFHWLLFHHWQNIWLIFGIFSFTFFIQSFNLFSFRLSLLFINKTQKHLCLINQLNFWMGVNQSIFI